MKEGIYLNLNKNYRFYIDGMWEESKSKEVIKIMSPYKDELVGTVQAISKDEADKAIQSAKLHKRNGRNFLSEIAVTIYIIGLKSLKNQRKILQRLLCKKSVKDFRMPSKKWSAQLI